MSSHDSELTAKWRRAGEAMRRMSDEPNAPTTHNPYEDGVSNA